MIYSKCLCNQQLNSVEKFPGIKSDSNITEFVFHDKPLNER